MKKILRFKMNMDAEYIVVIEFFLVWCTSEEIISTLMMHKYIVNNMAKQGS